MTDLLLVEKVARAIRQARFERSGLGQVFDFEVPLHETELLDARAAIAAMPGYEAGLVEGARAQWEPIESAPKDGTRIWVYAEARTPANALASVATWQGVISWIENPSGRTVLPPTGWAGLPNANMAEWDYSNSFENPVWISPIPMTPTHWMPLPPPPSIADDGK